MCSCVEPVSGGPRVQGPYVLVCGAGQYQCVTGEIVGISPTLVVGGELNQHKSVGSLSPLGLAFGV